MANQSKILLDIFNHISKDSQINMISFLVHEFDSRGVVQFFWHLIKQIFDTPFVYLTN